MVAVGDGGAMIQRRLQSSSHVILRRGVSVGRHDGRGGNGDERRKRGFALSGAGRSGETRQIGGGGIGGERRTSADSDSIQLLKERKRKEYL